MPDVFDLALYFASRRAADAAHRTAHDAAAAARETSRRLRDLEEHVDRLTLHLAAACELLVERAGVSAEALRERVRTIDLRDGTLDGRIAPAQASPCAACGRVFAARHVHCIYCGAPRAGHTGPTPPA